MIYISSKFSSNTGILNNLEYNKLFNKSTVFDEALDGENYANGLVNSLILSPYFDLSLFIRSSIVSLFFNSNELITSSLFMLNK